MRKMMKILFLYAFSDKANPILTQKLPLFPDAPGCAVTDELAG